MQLRKNRQTAKAFLTTRVNPEIFTKITAYAAENETTVSTVMRIILARWADDKGGGELYLHAPKGTSTGRGKKVSKVAV